MNLLDCHPRVIEDCRRLALDGLSARQIARRAKELLSTRLNVLTDEYRLLGFKVGKARRLALMDHRYVEYIDELIHLRYQAHTGRMALERALLWRDAQRSLNSARSWR